MPRGPSIGAVAAALLLPASLLAGPAAARAEGAATAEQRAFGKAIAENWCANCHVVGPAQRLAPGDAAPPFAAVARMPSTTPLSLRVFLQTPHARMPDYRLSQGEMDAVIAYILGLRDGR